MDTNREKAARIAAIGWPVFPCAGKRPITPRGFHDATSDPERVGEWWTEYPTAEVGVALPPGTLAVDVDDLQAFAATGLALPAAPEQHTPSGGIHRLYRVCAHARQTVKTFPGVDTRVGGKGYIIAWEPGAFATLDLPPAPDWVYPGDHEPCRPSWGTMTIREAAASLGLVADTLRWQVHNGRLAAFKRGRDWHVTPAEVERYRRESRRSSGV